MTDRFRDRKADDGTSPRKSTPLASHIGSREYGYRPVSLRWSASGPQDSIFDARADYWVRNEIYAARVAAIDGNVTTLRRIREGGHQRVLSMDWKYTLSFVAENGHLDVFRELRYGWGLSAPDVPISENQQALFGAAREGHLSIVKFLREDWGLSLEDAIVDDCAAVRATCYFGRIAVLREFRDNWGITADDLRNAANEPLRIAIAYGQIDIVRELREVWDLGAEDARQCSAVAAAASNGQSAILRELREVWGLTADDARQCKALAEAVSDGSGTVVRELREGYGLTADDARIQKIFVMAFFSRVSAQCLREIRIWFGHPSIGGHGGERGLTYSDTSILSMRVFARISPRKVAVAHELFEGWKAKHDGPLILRPAMVY